MPNLKILTEQELRQIVHLDLEAVDCIESAFSALAGGNVVMPSILTLAIEDFNGEVDVKTAYVPGIDSFAIKISPGFFDNPKLGLPSTSGLMVLFSVQTGMVEAVLLDNGYLTDIRTAAAGAVAARSLSREDSETVCIVGAGRQSQLQLEALCLVRPIKSATIWARDSEKAETVAEDLAKQLGISVFSETRLNEAVSNADIVVTTTPSSKPLLMHEWLKPGQHVTSMGSDQEHKNELDPECFRVAELYVPDRQSQTEKLGELHHALESRVVSEDAQFPELGDIVSGKFAFQRTQEAITICDLTGTGVQDTAIATFASERASLISAGIEIEAQVQGRLR